MSKTVYQVSNGVVSAEFPKTAIEKMKVLNLIQSRGSSLITRDGKPVRIYRYTASFDSRPVRGKW